MSAEQWGVWFGPSEDSKSGDPSGWLTHARSDRHIVESKEDALTRAANMRDTFPSVMYEARPYPGATTVAEVAPATRYGIWFVSLTADGRDTTPSGWSFEEEQTLVFNTPEEASHVAVERSLYSRSTPGGPKRHEVREYPNGKPVEVRRNAVPAPPGYSRGAGVKYDGDKLLYRLVDALALREVVAVLTYGAVLYGPENWRKIEALEERYTDALMRHVEAVRMGETFDEESGLLHLGHAGCCVLFLLGAKLAREFDTRDTFRSRLKHAIANARRIRTEREARSTSPG